jgi:hypothetical protein
MSDTTRLSEGAEKGGVASELWQIAGLPDWLEAAARPEIVSAALARHIPEFVSGDLVLRSCKLKRMRLKDTSGRWGGVYALKVDDPRSAGAQTMQLRATLSAPGIQRDATEEQPHPNAFGVAEWRCSVPELGMQFEIEPPDAVLAAMPALSDSQQSRELLERSIRAAAPSYHDLRIERCTPHVLSYKPGTRGTIRYDLEYPSDLAGRGWPEIVIGKTYRGNKGQIAYEGMRALWQSPLAAGDVVTIAEPLAYIPDLKVLFQRSIAEERILEDVLKSALSNGSPEALDELHYFVRKAAGGLAAFHSSKAHYGEVVTWADRVPDVRKIVDRLVVPIPELASAVMPLLDRLEALDAAQPAEAPVPTHGTFKPEQVLIHGRQIGFIDFDEFCMAEPALDIAVFLAAIKDVGLTSDDTLQSAPLRQERLALLEAIGEAFLEEYARRAPLSRQRVALWEALEYINDVLDCWIKVKPAEVTTTMLILKHHLRRMEL